MNIWRFNGAGEYVGHDVARYNSASMLWDIPGNATTIEPPATGAHEIAIFSAGAWRIAADWRGAALWSIIDGARRVIIDQVDVLPGDVGATEQPRPSAHYDWSGTGWSVNNDKVQEIIWAIIKAERDRRTEDGGFNVGGNWFHSDRKSRLQQLELVLLGDAMPPNLQWKIMGGINVDMTPVLAREVLAAGAANARAIFSAALAHKIAMESSKNAIDYDYTAGWPETFVG